MPGGDAVTNTKHAESDDLTPEQRIGETFRRVALHATLFAGSWQFFIVALLGVILWAAAGPAMGYTDTWQLIINTPTTILTFLLGILILLEQNRQARESKLVHDELLRSTRTARNELVNVDHLTDAQIDKLEEDLRQRAEREAARRRR
jgi:low affinity Fe/Cu permease